MFALLTYLGKKATSYNRGVALFITVASLLNVRLDCRELVSFTSLLRAVCQCQVAAGKLHGPFGRKPEE